MKESRPHTGWTIVSIVDSIDCVYSSMIFDVKSTSKTANRWSHSTNDGGLGHSFCLQLVHAGSSTWAPMQDRYTLTFSPTSCVPPGSVFVLTSEPVMGIVINTSAVYTKEVLAERTSRCNVGPCFVISQGQNTIINIFVKDYILFTVRVHLLTSSRLTVLRKVQ